MCDRGNIVVHYPSGQQIFFYSHWTGSDLPKILADALDRGHDRWDDEQYLPRIIFSEMIKDDVLDTTGYGISLEQGDGGTEVHVDLDRQLVWLEDSPADTQTFDEWIRLYD